MAMLNLLNRALVVLLLVVLMVIGLTLAIAPSVLAGQMQVAASTLVGGDRIQQVGAGFVVAAIAVGLLYLEVRVRGSSTVSLAGEPGASLSATTIVERLREDVEEVMDVVRVRPSVAARRGQVDVTLAVDTTSDVEVPAKAAEVRQVAAATVERLGLKLGKLNVRLSQVGRGPTETPPASPL